MPETRVLHDSVDSLLAGVEHREEMVTPGKSGARLERVFIGGEPHVVKYLDVESDWTMRAAGVPGGATVELWFRGLLDELPECFNQPIIAVARGPVSALLMRDVSPWLVPATDEVLLEEQHERFLDHMAAMHASFWGTDRDIDVVSARRRYTELSPAMSAAEAQRGSDALVPRLVGQGWPMLAEVAPLAASIVVPLVHEPEPLVRALAQTPQTFVHGNWKLDNLGTDDLGRTVILDWENPGRAAPLSDLAWYLAINCRRLPRSKEDTIASYRAALERHGVEVGRWWDTQLPLALLGALVLFGWEKAFSGYDDELIWWEEWAVRAAPLLG
ncbi:MAG: hypothetical protein JWR52_3517 [Marmoricola sp.]|nr:hypothetical protein [Marmoricola sp.]